MQHTLKKKTMFKKNQPSFHNLRYVHSQELAIYKLKIAASFACIACPSFAPQYLLFVYTVLVMFSAPLRKTDALRKKKVRVRRQNVSTKKWTVEEEERCFQD